MTDDEARYLVDYYYLVQDDRKRAASQERAMAGEPNLLLGHLAKQAGSVEETVRKALDDYTGAHVMGSWMRAVKGIGPVLSAGLLAHLDITRCPTVGHMWRYCGLDPSVMWPSSEQATAWVREHGTDVYAAARAFGRNAESLLRMAARNKQGEAVQLTATTLARALSRRPWNASAKVLCWKIGQSFLKFSGDEECVYGRAYRKRKAYEIERNESGGNSAAASTVLAKVGKTTEAFKHAAQGKLSPGQIDARARRWAVKLFLAHLHGEWYRRHYGTEPPAPYPIAILGHAHEIRGHS
jgi:hypothetical protein